ncbi:MAG: hypothetical protein IAC77_01465 [Proteobacteria bacterium]|uniref:TrbL/VirB6 plasmid conjugal transfer protein n=1 Tax=Candidatus Enterousia excrementavium TaxID=2840789 RepID=A0A940DDK2_9PROT|nr:hypothetical protein [Candidatus Enterousia excrementavium]
MRLLKFVFMGALAAITLCSPIVAHAAEHTIVDALNLAPIIPTILDALMAVASGGYEFFVGEGDGIIYLLVWGFLAVTLVLYVVKMYFPKTWVSFFGFSGGGEMIGGIDGMTIATNALKPCIRAIVAVTVLLQIKPVYLTEWLINPFLQFGALYTESITNTVNEAGVSAPQVDCPPSIVEQGWITQESCEFLVQPVSDISHANNQIIKRGFDFLLTGLRGLITPMSHGGESFLNVVTGIILIFTFVASNLFMAMLIIQAIFNFGMALVLYPFQVLTYVAKPNDKWLDIWPAFGGITKALQQIIVTMIACAFILCINIAVVKALFQWNSSVFVVAAGGTATSNVPTVANNAMGFGEHSIMWLSAILTFYLMFRIFNMTRGKLNDYVGKGMDNLYNQVKGDANTAIKVGKGIADTVGLAFGWKKKK